MWSEALDQSTKTYTIYYYQTYATIIELGDILITQNSSSGGTQYLTFSNVSLVFDSKDNYLVTSGNGSSDDPYVYDTAATLTTSTITYTDSEFEGLVTTISDQTLSLDVNYVQSYDTTATLSFDYNDVTFTPTFEISDAKSINATFTNGSQEDSDIFDVNKTIYNETEWNSETQAYEYSLGFRLMGDNNNNIYFYKLDSGSFDVTTDLVYSDGYWHGYVSYSFTNEVVVTNYYYLSNTLYSNTITFIPDTNSETNLLKFGRDDNDLDLSEVNFEGSWTYSVSESGETNTYTLTSTGWYKKSSGYAAMYLVYYYENEENNDYFEITGGSISNGLGGYTSYVNNASEILKVTILPLE